MKALTPILKTVLMRSKFLSISFHMNLYKHRFLHEGSKKEATKNIEKEEEEEKEGREEEEKKEKEEEEEEEEEEESVLVLDSHSEDEKEFQGNVKKRKQSHQITLTQMANLQTEMKLKSSFDPKPYQLEAVNWMASVETNEEIRGGFLVFPTGSGKTGFISIHYFHLKLS